MEHVILRNRDISNIRELKVYEAHHPWGHRAGTRRLGCGKEPALLIEFDFPRTFPAMASPWPDETFSVKAASV